MQLMPITKTYWLALALVFVAALPAASVHGQDTLVNEPGPQLKKVDCRLTWEGGVGSLFGMGYAFTGVAPEIRYHVNERFAISAGAKISNGFTLNKNYNISPAQRSLAPHRQTARVYEMYVGGEYQVNDRLWLAASILHIGGTFDMPLFLATHSDGRISATAFTADFRYLTRKGNMLGLHLSYVNDQTGILAPCLYNPCMDGLWGYGERWSSGFNHSFGFFY